MTNRYNGGVTGASVLQSGTISADTQDFTGDGTWNPVSPAITSVDLTVIAGGGSGGGQTGGGGGAGGLRQMTGVSVSGPVAVTIGGGGSGGPGGGSAGNPSVFAAPGTPIIATRGGNAGRAATDSGGSGGSGGGGSGGPGGPGAGTQGQGNTPPFSPPQGNPGSATPDGKGGGGGSSSAASGSTKGNGTAPSLIPGSTFTVGGQGGSGGSAAGGSTGDGGDGRSGTGAGGNGGSGRVRVFTAAQPFSFYGSGVWDMNALYTYVKAGQWS